MVDGSKDVVRIFNEISLREEEGRREKRGRSEGIKWWFQCIPNDYNGGRLSFDPVERAVQRQTSTAHLG